MEQVEPAAPVAAEKPPLPFGIVSVIEPVPPLKERLRLTLVEPAAAFARHDAAWGWIGPWAIVALAGVLYGLIYLARVDVTALQAVAQERALDANPMARKAMNDPAAAEAVQTVQRFTAFATKVQLVAGPPFAGLAGILLAGGLMAAASALPFSGRKGRVEPMRALSLAAHCSLVNLVGIGAQAIGALSGNPMPDTSPANLVDPFTHPVAYAALGRLDPVTIYYYALVAAGLEGSLRLAPRVARGLAWGTFALVSLLSVAFTAAGAAMGGGA